MFYKENLNIWVHENYTLVNSIQALTGIHTDELCFSET